MEKVNVQKLLESGSHFGHQSKKWNPKMKSFILRKKGDIHIIDLVQTLYCMDDAFSYVSNLVKKGGVILFVGTKKQAQDVTIEQASRCGMPYVNNRWLGGMLTNFDTIRRSVRRMENLEAMQTDGRLEKLTKKEQIILMKELTKLQLNLNGIRNMKKLPDCIFVCDTNKEEIAVKEARKLNIPIVGTLDTNSDPDSVDQGIPINDDAIKSVKLIVEFIAEAVLAGQGAVTMEEMLKEQAKKKEEEQKQEQKEAAKKLVEKKAQTLTEILSSDNSEGKDTKDTKKEGE